MDALASRTAKTNDRGVVAVRPDCIAKPANPVPRGIVPAGGQPYKVKDGDSWQSLAAGRAMDAWALIRYNYPSLSPDNRLAVREVNWYLRWYVGCFTVTADATNYIFSSRDNPGIVYLPPAQIKLNFWRFNTVLPYMYGEMITNANSDAVANIRALNTGAAVNSKLKVAALAAWAWLVRPGGVWDHKPILRRTLKLGPGDNHFPFEGDTEHEYFYDIWSNIHYGYVGRAAGFARWELEFGHQVPVLAGATDPYDLETVRIGLDLWDRHQINLTKLQLHQAILARTKTLLQIQETKEYIDVQKKGKDPDFKHIQPLTDGQ